MTRNPELRFRFDDPTDGDDRVKIKVEAFYIELPEFELWRAIQDGVIPLYRLTGEHCVLRMSEVLALIVNKRGYLQ